MQQEPESSGNDPLGLNAADREIRIEKLQQQLNEISGGEMISHKAADCDPELEEAFLEQVLALETQGFICPFDVLMKDGVPLPAPEELDDAALNPTLWELIRALAKRRLFLYHTNHLSDRALYAWLWSEGLREELMGFGLPFGNCHLDVTGSGSDEDISIQMRYYASEKERADWSADFPDFPMPPREQPPFDRDRDLPQAEPLE